MGTALPYDNNNEEPKMKAVQYAAGFALVLAGSACGGGISVTSDWDPSFDFAQAQTFTVLDETGGDDLPALQDARVKTALVKIMEAKGFREVADTAEADLAVGYQFTSEQRSSYQTVNTGWNSYGYGSYGGWYRYGAYGPSMTTSQTTERRYDVGALMIAIFDTKARAMVYHSTGTKELAREQLSPDEWQRRIDYAVEDIMIDFPPGN